jgi:hypothetical protein
MAAKWQSALLRDTKSDVLKRAHQLICSDLHLHSDDCIHHSGEAVAVAFLSIAVSGSFLIAAV